MSTTAEWEPGAAACSTADGPYGAVLARAVGATKRYRSTVALNRVDLAVPAGAITGVLGPNGAGKSTLLNLMVGLRRPDAGRVELFGGSPHRAAQRVDLGMTPQETGLPPTLRVREVVAFVGRHYPNSLPVTALLEQFGLTGLERRQTGGLSGGQKRRLAVALAFVGQPRLVVLDEPTTGLDVEGRHALWDAVRGFRDAGGGVLMTSHYLEEIEQLADRVVVIGHGQVIAEGGVADVRDRVTASRVSLRADTLPELPAVARMNRMGDRIDLQTTDADGLIRELVLSGVPFSDLQVRPASLEEAFLSLTGTDSRPAHSGSVNANGGRP